MPANGCDCRWWADAVGTGFRGELMNRVVWAAPPRRVLRLHFTACRRCYLHWRKHAPLTVTDPDQRRRLGLNVGPRPSILA